MNEQPLKVGELSKRTGVSVRTLHYYDQIGLLRPSHHTEGGHRLYLPEDVAALQRILSLRQLGFSLEEIRTCLEDPEYSPLEVIHLHMQQLRQQIELEQQLYQRLETLAAQLDSSSEDPPVEILLDTIEGITMIEKYYTPEQLDELKERREQMGDEAIRRAEQEWAELIAQAREHMRNGTDPASEPVQTIGRRWIELINAFTGGNPEIAKSLGTMYKQEGPEKASHGMLDAEVFEYMGKVFAEGGREKGKGGRA
jgi:DNA-binding transcriptional MerR regulator